MKIRKLIAAIFAALTAACLLSITAFAAEKLPAPKNVKVTSGSTAATVKWDKVDGADAYKVLIFDEAKNKYVTYKNVTGSSCTIKGLDPAKEYKIKVASCVRVNGKLVKQSTSKAKTVKTAEANSDKIKVTNKDPGFSVKIYDSKKADFIFDNVKSIKKDSGDYYSVSFENDYSKYNLGLYSFEGEKVRCNFGVWAETLGGKSDEGAVCYGDILILEYRFENGKLIISADLDNMKFTTGTENLKKHIKIDFDEITDFLIVRHKGNTHFSKTYSANKVVVK